MSPLSLALPCFALQDPALPFDPNPKTFELSLYSGFPDPLEIVHVMGFNFSGANLFIFELCPLLNFWLWCEVSNYFYLSEIKLNLILLTFSL